MKKLFLCALVLQAAAANAPAQSPAAAAPQVAATTQSPAAPAAARAATVKVGPVKLFPEEIFAAELKDLDDADFSLGEYRGRVFVLNFWASWCGPCRMEIPELNKLYEEYAPRGVEFVGLTTEAPGAASERVREFAREFKMLYRNGWADPDVAAALMTRRAIPQTIVVAADGRIVARFVGYSKTRSPQMLRAGIEQALTPPPAEAEEEEEAEPAPAAPAQTSPAVPPAAPETSRPPRT